LQNRTIIRKNTAARETLMCALKRKRFEFAGYSYINLFTNYSIVLLYKVLPIIVVYSMKNIPEKAVACTKFFTIRIKPRFRNDLSVITHEVTHVKQIIKTGAFHYLFYNFCNKYRYRSELEAYAHQCIHLIITSGIGFNTVLLDQLVNWVIKILTEDMQFLTILDKTADEIRMEFMSEIIILLKKYKDIL
jgi:hypothetical protein